MKLFQRIKKFFTKQADNKAFDEYCKNKTPGQLEDLTKHLKSELNKRKVS